MATICLAGCSLMDLSLHCLISEKEQHRKETFLKQVYKIVEERWNTMATFLHLAFALSLKYYSADILSVLMRITPYRDYEVAEGYKTTFQKPFSAPNLQDVFMSEFIDFVHSNGQSIEALRNNFKQVTHNWWYLHGWKF